MVFLKIRVIRAIRGQKKLRELTYFTFSQRASKKPNPRVLLSGGFAALIEFSQALHSPWLDALRDNLCARLVLGQGFLWSDLVCYAAAIALGVVLELALRARRRA